MFNIFKRKIGRVTDVGTPEWRARKRAVAAHNPIAQDMADVIPYKIWDTATVAKNVQVGTEIQFFTTPQSATKGKLLTNLEQAGRLPDPRHFYVRAMRIIFGSDMLLVDIQAMLKNYYLEFWIGNKIYMEGPIQLFPGGAGIVGVTTNTATETWGLGAQDPTSVDDFGDKGFSILQGQTFKVRCLLGTATAPTMSNNTTPASTGLTMICVLDGLIAREVQ